MCPSLGGRWAVKDREGTGRPSGVCGGLGEPGALTGQRSVGRAVSLVSRGTLVTVVQQVLRLERKVGEKKLQTTLIAGLIVGASPTHQNLRTMEDRLEL